MKPERILSLNPLLHAPLRLAVMSVLMTVRSAGFGFLKEATGATDGNLSTHLSKLEAEDLIEIRKTFKGKKPHTECAVTDKGRQAFREYLDQLERIVRDQKVREEKNRT